MKQFYLKTLISCLLAMTGIYVSAQNINYFGIASPTIEDIPVKTAHRIAKSTKAPSASDFFKANTIEGVEILFSIVSEEEKTCQVGGAVPDQEGYYYIAIDESVTGTVTIPETANGYKVIGIETVAFGNCTGITNVTIPDGMTTIGRAAFDGCTGLTKVIIPNSVNSIGSDAFSGCSGLTSVTINSNIIASRDHTASSYGKLVHFFGKQVKEYILGEGVEKIGSYMFYGCTNLSNITIPNSVTHIGNYAFNGCSGLTSITIPNSVTSIGKDAFSGTSWYDNQPYGLLYIGKCLYKYKGTMPSNTSVDTKEGTVQICSSAFSDCTGLTSITIPNSVTSIGDYAFKGCSGLTSITIPNSVTSIGDYAFWRCSGLTSITIPNSVTSIGDYAFLRCSSLTSITIPSSVTNIGNYTFNGCSSLTSITIPNSVTSIGNDAFSGCTGLESITIPNSVTSIGDYAFSSCSGLTSITIPNGVTILGDGVFQDCSGLTSITIPNNVTSIGIYAFGYCTGLTDIIIPNGVTTIENNAFRACTNLSSITIPNSLTTIGDEAFRDCNLSEIKSFIENPFAVGESTFPMTRNTLLIVPYGTKEKYSSTAGWNKTSKIKDIIAIVDGILYSVYSDNSNNTNPNTACLEKAPQWMVYSGNVKIPGILMVAKDDFLVTYIGDGAFENSQISSVIIHKKIESIGERAFKGCSQLHTIKSLIVKPNNIPQDVFSEIPSDAILYVPVGSKSRYQAASGWNSIPNIVETNFTTDDSEYFDGDTFSSKTIEGVSLSYKILSVKDHTCTVISSERVEGCVTIPQETNGFSVIGIDNAAFEYCNKISEIIIPNSIKTIGSDAFAGCWALTNIVLPESIEHIGRGAFIGCSDINEVTIKSKKITIGYNAFTDACNPNIVTLYCENINYEGSNWNKSLKEVFGQQVKKYSLKEVSALDNYTFEGSSSLENVDLDNSILSIRSSSFAGCNNLQEITLPRSLSVIGSDAFNGCTSLTDITIPNGVISIGQRAFYGCTGLTSITIPDSTTYIGPNAFANCTNLTKVNLNSNELVSSSRSDEKGFSKIFGTQVTTYTLGENITEIGWGAFEGCTSMTSINIPNSVKIINFGAFSGCTNLLEITIPSSIEFLICPFNHNSYLKTVTIDSKFGYRYGYVGNYNYNTSCSEIFGEQVEKYIIGEHITEIGNNAFNDCTNLKEIIIPVNVRSIGNNAFQNCSNLSNVSISNSVTNIGNYAFSGCESLPNIILPNSLTTIGNNIFEGCSNLNSILIPASVKSIGYNAFSGCDNLNKVIIPDISSWCRIEFQDYSDPESISNPLSIAHHIYSDKDTEIVDLVIPNGVDSIKENVFYGCTNLNSVKIPSSVKYIGKKAFGDCKSLNKIIVPDIASWCRIKFGDDYNCEDLTTSNPLSIAHHLYSDENTEITDLVIPEGVESINESVFFGANSLQSVSIPSSMKSIGEYAFYNCLGLEKVIVPDLAAWCNIEFGDNPLSLAGHLYSDSDTEITDLKIPASVKKINGYTFMGANSLTSLSVPNSVMTIGDGAFFGCSKIKSLVIPNGLQTIGEYAFSECSGLETLVIPNSVKTIGYNAFADCMSLYSVTSLINMPFKLNESAFRYTGEDYNTDVIYMAATLYVPRGKMTMYKMTEGWMKFINVAEIDTKFKLTYMLDGELYKTYEIQATEVITPEPDPYKEGYIFSGWSNIPYLMPAHDVTVTGSFSIDPNTGISTTKESVAVPEAYYSPEGRRLDAPQRGINIVKMNNGTTRKVFVK